MSLSLAVNCGSSSIKFKVFAASERIILSGSAKDVQGDSPPSFSFRHYKDNDDSGKGNPFEKKLDEATSYEATFEAILSEVTRVLAEGEGPSSDLESNKSEGNKIGVIAHRIVHGGTATEPIVIRHGSKEEQATLDRMDAVSSFAPLHNHHAMLIVKTCLEKLPSATSVLCFDTLFHTSIPDYRTRYAISEPKHKTPVPLKRYGFHGLSYANIVDQMSKALNKPVQKLNIVVAHLGSGASCCMIQGGKSRDTTMGLTPLEGLPGGTRAGSLDPSLVFHHTPDCSNTVQWSGRDISKAEYVLNKDSGFKALAGTSDFGLIISRAFPSDEASGGKISGDEEEQKKARLTYDLYLDRLLGFLSSYIVTLLASSEGMDALVFSGGIGERSARLRADVLHHFEWIEKLGNTRGGVDRERNEKEQGRRKLTLEGSKIEAWVVETNEEVECVRLAKRANGAE
ncbi:BQ5605_C010g05976 [Microbotryum silenes-dioicae]|uniref:Probable acetate kinase n=1 Tax=Microbotryum silenes-dioicae TaxID=796604 RepID=A0A2X0NU47_9BASI|nr:BQ5605_C010g05976 [Microbotryum silenes-dioicae]